MAEDKNRFEGRLPLKAYFSILPTDSFQDFSNLPSVYYSRILLSRERRIPLKILKRIYIYIHRNEEVKKNQSIVQDIKV